MFRRVANRLFLKFRLSRLRRSPCLKMGLTEESNPFPCLSREWKQTRCPVCVANPDEITKIENDMYRMGYTEGAWVVRWGRLGKSKTCSIVFFREHLTEENIRHRFGRRYLRHTPLSPKNPTKPKP